MRQFRPSVALFGIAVIYFVAGCGGNGSAGIASTTTGGSTGGAANPTNNVTATVHVNVKTGQVTIAPVAGVINTKVFQGNRIGFNSSVLLDEPGDVGRKVLKVSLVNHSSESIGVDPNGNVAGLRVVFGTFTNSVSIPDLRPQTQVSTFAGTGVAGFADGGTSAAQFNAPVSVATTADGSVYVADQGNNKIRKISNGYVSTFAGNGTAAEVDGLGGSASFKTPLGIAINPVDGSLIVGDYGGNKIRRITTAGRVYTIAGTGATGGNNATGNSATFDRPWAVSTDQYGHIYVTEDSGRIRKIFLTAGANPNLSGSYTVVTFAGAGGAGSFADGIGVNAHFNGPHGVAVDPSGNVYIADQFNNRIRFIGAGAEVVTIAGDGTIVDLDGTGDVATLGNPSGIVWYNGALFVTESDGSRVRELFPNKGAPLANASSWNVTSLAGNGAPAVQDGQGDSAEFNRPNALAVDKSGGLLVVAQLENTVRRVIPSSGFFPLGIPVGGTPPAEPVTLANPTGIVANSFNPFITYAGSIAAGATSPSLDWVFTIPSGVSAFQFTVSVIADSAHIAQVSANVGSGSVLNQVATLAGNPGHRGYSDGVGPSALFNFPRHVAVDGNGTIYGADSGNVAIRRVDSSGKVTTIAGGRGLTSTVDGPGNTAGFAFVDGIAANKDGSVIYVADYTCIRRITWNHEDATDPGNWFVTTIAGSVSSGGHFDGTGDVALFSGPQGLALDSGGTVYVAEYSNYIRRIRFLGGDQTVANNYAVSTMAGNGTGGYTNGNGSAATFNQPSGICVDAAGNLYVAEPPNEDIRKVSPAGAVTTFAGNNPPNSLGYNDGTGATAQFFTPRGVAVDSAGYVYVTETDNCAVRRISPSGYVETVAGHNGATTVDGPGNLAGFYGPWGIAIAPSGTLYVADWAGHDVRSIGRVLNQGSLSGKR